ncbi:fatty-acyl-CoA synthase [Geomicrobium halophilum]|uniref:Fatty-acyl-CoA synthase n=1 Tax=Geomicrobium halophilum TaxID=549000 RepID=A0A841PWA2_9BACL|nr:fatty acid--CoA ligase [Geomicrobium halophilum]MBB6448095.1 fatty-acyl-CoA synthase [Geomicrobium halophilum]
MSITLGKLFELSVEKFSTKEALYDARLDQRWTFKEWDDEINRLAETLRIHGIEKGDRVSTILFNTSEFAHAYFACAKLGAVFNPINFRLSEKEIEYIIRDAAPKIVLFEQAVEKGIQPVVERHPNIKFWSIDHQPVYADYYYDQVKNTKVVRPKLEEIHEDDVYAVMYTSGTTGKPKGVIHTHRDMVDQSLILMASQRLSSNDRGLSVAPMFHCAELHCAFLPRVHVGASNVILHHFEPHATLEILKKERITAFFAAPTMWNMMLQEDRSSFTLPSLRLGLYGGAPMAPALVQKVKQQFNVDLIQAYGMTEMGPAITVLFEGEQMSKAGSAGKPLLNHEVRIARMQEEGRTDPGHLADAGELGEIIVSGPSMMKEYFNNPEATREVLRNGWYFSGDIGYMDEEGFLYVNDRIKDMIISGGENIYSREVEDALFEHPEVLDAAVIGIPDEKWGEKVTAFIVKKSEGITAGELEEFCLESDRLANYKRPRQFKFVNDLPRNASGKLQKYLLRDQVKG